MVTPGYYPIKGGTETVVQDLTVELNRRGVIADVLTFNMCQKWKPKWNMKTETTSDYKIYRIPALNWFPIHSSGINLDINVMPGRFTQLFRQYDIIHFHGSDDVTFPTFSFLVGKPKIMHSHGFNDFRTYKRYLNKFLLRVVADLYISITRQHAGELNELGIPKEKIIYLPNSVDTTVFSPAGERIGNLVLFVGRIQHVKGLHVLLKALRHIKKPVSLIVAGPPVLPLEYFHNIMNAIEESNRIGPHTIKYLGSMDRDDLVQWYQKAAVLVCPSLGESFGIVNAEALSCGTPVVATNVGGIPEVVHNYENGILVPVNDYLKMAESIQYLLDHEDIRNRFGMEGRRSVLENYSRDRVTARLVEIYERLLANDG
jgi:glycosyltransferase involved in cell wall biosynthesis